MGSSLTNQSVASAAAVAVIDGYTAKIDNLSSDGITGTVGSVAYMVHATELHFHNIEHWRGKLDVQTVTDWADDNLAPFIAISGNNAYGSDVNDEALVIGTDDTPITAGSIHYDLHRMIITSATSQTPYKVRIIYGSGTMANAIAAKQFSEIMFIMDTTVQQQPHGPVPLRMPLIKCGIDKVWAQCWNVSNNATISFLVGLHEYPG